MTKLSKDDRVVEGNRVGTVARGGDYTVLVVWDGTDRQRYHAQVADLKRASLVRTNGGGFVHRQECFMARRGGAMPWLWADTVPEAEVADACARFGYRTCARCRPVNMAAHLRRMIAAGKVFES